jgi:phytoene synthase
MRIDDPTAGNPHSPIRIPHSSYSFCRRAVRRAGSSFGLAFRLLPPDRRRGMDALYAFMRATDDISDEPGDPDAKRRKLDRWRDGLRLALGGAYRHRLHAALHHTVTAFGVPPRHLFDVIDGVEADLRPVRVGTFADLYPYCYRVASAVGLACVPVWGCHDPAAAGPAEAAGIAFQLTNILRDLAEDAGRGRVYLPADELARFGCPPEAWGRVTPEFREMMRFQAARARGYYAEGDRLLPLLPPPGRAIFRAMSGTYRGLLDEIERRDFDVFARRVRLPGWRKAAAFARAWLESRTGRG